MKTPLIILHGWAADHQNELKWQPKWQPLMEQLTAAGTQVNFLPLPGLSSTLEKAWQLNDYVNWLHKQLAEYKKVVLLGHSFGGQLAVRYTSIFPEKVDSLVLVDPAGIRPFSTKARVKRAVFQTAAKLGKVLFPLHLGRVLLHKIAREHDYLQASPVMRETMRNVLADEIKNDLQNIQAETLILWGDQDTATPVTHAQLFSSGIENSQLHFIAGARHSPQFTHVQQTAQHIISFLQQTQGK
jgi:pimeloyl-ACP methyl ester carboxylesterase